MMFDGRKRVTSSPETPHHSCSFRAVDSLNNQRFSGKCSMTNCPTTWISERTCSTFDFRRPVFELGLQTCTGDVDDFWQLPGR